MDNPNEIEITFRRSELLAKPVEWMRKEYRHLLPASPDKYHEMLGLLVDFMTDLADISLTEGLPDGYGGRKDQPASRRYDGPSHR